jgi:hypothetical protein
VTKREFEEELANLLNAAPKAQRRKVEQDIIYQMCKKDGDMKEAYKLAYGIIHGAADNVTQMRRMVKKRRKQAGPADWM